MARAVRLILLVAALSPLFVATGCGTKGDSTPNQDLGPPPTIPPGRGGGDKGIAPADPKAPKPPK